ncbi:uncharacterized protein K452DRAFT_100956 [Aplosporella prunicola CBS 121167]|uniref:C2H2-type domain-containing protein n=1 Tax=Aplosporella prunicola CBS 121167 TaxID=1176127 RepID=A0A6A6B2H5_9PEZI|nr:uncharacterized protein K452DRAFT_100956 [Aplosporella prunicola CBS 121167]KAF2137455.1 hypothetical protein K452DRAFT_100956 [Aplosporella prunicola CBS 121167]
MEAVQLGTSGCRQRLANRLGHRCRTTRIPAQEPTLPSLSPSEAEKPWQHHHSAAVGDGRDGSARSGSGLEKLVRDVDRRFDGILAASPSKLAADDGLFLAALHLPLLPTVDLHLSWAALGLARRAIARLDNLLHGLRRSHDVASTFVSNLQHLLVVIQHALGQALSAVVRRGRRPSGLERCRRKVLGRFSEFAGGQRPVSTTWPWANVRPSLAVLWGVCWMFYEQQAKMRASWLGNFGWPMPREDEYATYGRTLLGGHVQQNTTAPHRQQHSQHSRQAQQQPPSLRQVEVAVAQLESSAPAATCDSLRPTLSPRSRQTSHEYKVNAWSDASGAQTQTTQALSRLWPYQSGIATRDDFDALFPSNIPTWPPHLLPQLIVEDLTPHPAPPHPQTFPMSTQTLVHHHHHPVMTTTTSDYKSIPPSPISMNGDSTMHQQNPRKRKAPDHPSVAVNVAAPHVQLVHSDRESSEERYDNYTPRGKYIHKRTEEPPRNSDGKMICTFSADCSSLTFERKCEWSKHMDKHDRPYVCRHKGCEKLQGFTYSGGLLRHEREVHKMHGGTKKALFCPHQDCKRSMGAGFTRKENLAEHIRRVHRRASASDAASAGVRVEEEGSERLSPDQEHDDAYHATAASSAAGKRRKTTCNVVGGGGGGEGGAAVAAVAASAVNGDDAPGAEADEDDLRAEIKRLRREIEEKDARLEKLEAAVEALSKQATTTTNKGG